MNTKTAKRTMLYVEDEATDVLFMKKALKRVGADFALETVSDGQKAIDYLDGVGSFADRTRHPLPDLILLDVNLPARSGFEVLQWIKEQPLLLGIPVIVFSSSGRPEDRSKAQELGADDYLLKPKSGLQFPEIVRHLESHWLVRADGL